MSLSKINISGTLAAKPEKRVTTNNVPVTTLKLLVTYIPRGISTNGENKAATKLIRVTAWRDLAERCCDFLNEGDKVLVNGRLQINAFTTEDGKKIKDAEIEASSVVKLSDILSIQNEHISDESESAERLKGPNSEDISDINEITGSVEEIPF